MIWWFIMHFVLEFWVTSFHRFLCCVNTKNFPKVWNSSWLRFYPSWISRSIPEANHPTATPSRQQNLRQNREQSPADGAQVGLSPLRSTKPRPTWWVATSSSLFRRSRICYALTLSAWPCLKISQSWESTFQQLSMITVDWNDVSMKNKNNGNALVSYQDLLFSW